MGSSSSIVGTGDQLDHERRQLFKDSGEETFNNAVASELLSSSTAMYSNQPRLIDLPDLHFLYHSWGYVPPVALQKALTTQFVLYSKYGNFTWDILFNHMLLEAANHVKRLLHVSDEYNNEHFVKPYLHHVHTSSDISMHFNFESSKSSLNLVNNMPVINYKVEFAHNSHELINRIFSTTFNRILGTACYSPMTIITTDAEFYSLTRQLNRLMEIKSSRINIVIVNVDPIYSFQTRLIEEINRQNDKSPVDFVYVSQVSYLQQTIISDVRTFVPAVKDAMDKSAGHWEGGVPMLIIDGYHCFGANDVSLHGLDCIWIAGTMKHIGAGPNLAFAVYPEKYVARMRPVNTGWLADASILGAGSGGISIGSPVNYSPGNPLAGSTPSFISSVILFNEVMNLWDIHGIDIYYVHKHVMKLHKLFFEGLKAQRALNRGSKYINMEKLVKSTRLLGEPQVEDESIRSHTLVFEQADAATAAAAITALADHGIACDSRKQFVRLGFGLKHSPEDIDRLVKALEYSGYNAFY